MRTNKKYRAIWLDVDGTLLDFDRAEEAGISQVLLACGLEDTAGQRELYHRINKEFWEAFERGEISRDRVLTGRFEKFFAVNGMRVAGDQAEKLYREQLESRVFLIDGAVEICRYLKNSYLLYIVTNGVSETQKKRLLVSGLSGYFENVFISEDTGSQKPQREFFDHCFTRTDAPAAEILIVGDSLTSDIQGGNNAGVDTCWFNPAGFTNDKGVRVDYEIQKLAQLRDIL